MAVPKGTRIGGRGKGTPNKDTQTLQEKAKELGCDPFVVLMHFAKGDYEALGYREYETKTFKDGSTCEMLTISPELRQKSASDAAQYLYPKRKAIEHSGSIDGAYTVEDFIRENGGNGDKANK